MKNIYQFILLLTITFSFSACAQKDNIVGVWDVKTDVYQATYEIVEHRDKFYGKVHYYNDGTSEYKGNDKKEDYFLSDVEFKDGKYINGKMYLPDGSYYNVIFTLKNNDTLEALMTVDSSPYKEIWKRNTSF